MTRELHSCNLGIVCWTRYLLLISYLLRPGEYDSHRKQNCEAFFCGLCIYMSHNIVLQLGKIIRGLATPSKLGAIITEVYIPDYMKHISFGFGGYDLEILTFSIEAL